MADLNITQPWAATTIAIGAGTPGSGHVGPDGLVAALSASTPNSLNNQIRRLMPMIDIREFGSISLTGVTDATTVFQLALNTAPFGSTIWVPPGLIDVFKVGIDYCLRLTRKVHIYCQALIRANLTGADVGVDLLKVAINDIGAGVGVGDVRFLKLKLDGYLSGGGRSAVRVEAVLPMLRTHLFDSSIYGLNGYAAAFMGDLQGTIVEGNTINGGVEFGGLAGVYHADNIIVRDNTIFGAHASIKMDMIYGSYSHAITNNTLVSDGGGVDIINGSQVKIRDNQFEQPNASTHAYSAQLAVHGTRYPSESVDITGNNFGGGLNVNFGIITVACEEMNIDDNDFYPCAIADVVYVTADSKNNKIGRANRYRGTRPAAGFAALAYSDSGVGNVGYRKFLSTLTFTNGWTAPDSFVVVSGGVARFAGTLAGGTLTAGTGICTLPVGYRPLYVSQIPVVTSGGLGWLIINEVGVVSVGSVPGATVYLDGTQFETKGDI